MCRVCIEPILAKNQQIHFMFLKRNTSKVCNFSDTDFHSILTADVQWLHGDIYVFGTSL